MVRDDQGNRERGPHHRPQWIVICLAVPICLLATLALLQTARLQGDYLNGVTTMSFFRLSMEPLPTFTSRLIPSHYMTTPRGMQPAGRYLPNAGGGFTLTGNSDGTGATYPFGSGVGSGTYPTPFGIPLTPYARVAGSRHHFERPPLGDAAGRRLEWFPKGSLTPVFDAIEDRDRTRFLKEVKQLDGELGGRTSLRYWIITTRIEFGDHAGARRDFDRWRGLIALDQAAGGPAIVDLLERILEATDADFPAKWEQHARALWADAREGDISGDLAETLEYVRAFGRREIAPVPVLDLIRHYNFLRYQITLKVATTEAVFAAVRGDWPSVDDLMRGALRLGQGAPVHGSNFLALIDASFSQIALDRVVDLYLHGPLPAEDLAKRWDWLVDCSEYLGEPDSWEAATLATSGEFDDPAAGFPEAGIVLRQLRYALALQAFRIRVFRQRTGEWPAGPDDPRLAELGQELPDGQDWGDPFALAEPSGGPQATASPSFSWRIDGDRFVLYSWGPDRDDDGGAAAGYYLPIGNRPIPDGDFVIELHAAPLYDFPLQPGYQYEDLREFDRRYPHRLPADRFGIGGIEPIRITRDGTNRVWSFGPDADQTVKDTYPFAGRVMEPLYDPTNGVTSPGDLWMVVDFKQPPPIGYPDPHLPADDSPPSPFGRP